MEDIIKVSIANVAFSIEREAHLRLEQYISSLEEHYAENPNADEIVSGIEERISEILSERGYRERIVPVAMVEELIAILGSVEDLDGDYVNSGTRKTQLKKRLYRDVENKLVGGVCAGLGAYFGLDPIIFRLAFSLAVILSIVFESELFLLWVVIYILLWIITPAAVTSFQKCRMRGEENNIGAIQRGVENGSRAAEKSFEGTRKVLSKISRILAVFCGLVVVAVGLCGIFVTIVGSLGLTLIDAAIPFSAADFMTMVTNCSKWV
ncbi:MAG: PspC domain-containing protein, partial [Bacteroidales bacterium]|nr:PspC domain-containing protein [Bacteroidales bacterium]